MCQRMLRYRPAVFVLYFGKPIFYREKSSARISLLVESTTLRTFEGKSSGDEELNCKLFRASHSHSSSASSFVSLEQQWDATLTNLKRKNLSQTENFLPENFRLSHSQRDKSRKSFCLRVENWIWLFNKLEIRGKLSSVVGGRKKFITR